MTAEETREFLKSGTRTGKIATVRADGRPHVAPIWFELDGDELIFTTWRKTVKAANLRRDPRISLRVDEETPPFAFVLIEGTATISEDVGELADWARQIAGRYMGQELAEACGKRNAVPVSCWCACNPIRLLRGKLSPAKNVSLARTVLVDELNLLLTERVG
jgi:PPOX class probable F420-dependent enzyme